MLILELLGNLEAATFVQLLSQPLSQWKNVKDPVSFCIPAVPLILNVQTAEESFSDHSFLIHCEDELLLQVSQAFLKQQEEKEDSLLLAVSQDYEKPCGLLMTSDDVQPVAVAQVLLKDPSQ